MQEGAVGRPSGDGLFSRRMRRRPRRWHQLANVARPNTCCKPISWSHHQLIDHHIGAHCTPYSLRFTSSWLSLPSSQQKSTSWSVSYISNWHQMPFSTRLGLSPKSPLISFWPREHALIFVTLPSLRFVIKICVHSIQITIRLAFNYCALHLRDCPVGSREK